MKFVCANADLIQGINLDTDYDYITAKAKSHVLAIETLANSFAKSKSDCVLFVWDTDDPNDLVRVTEQASLENINFKEVIDELKHYIDFSVLGDFDFKTFELENGMTISVVKYVTMNNFIESKELARKSIKESKNTEIKVYLDGHTTPSNKYQDYDFSPYSKKYEIVGLTEFKDDVILTFERGKAKSFTYLGVTVDFDKENNAKCDYWECEIDIDEVQEYIIKFRLSLFV